MQSRANPREEIKQKWVLRALGLGVIIGVGLALWYDYQQAIVVGSPYRHNLVYGSEQTETTFVSLDPVERQILAINYPKELEIKSRSVGSYKIGSLYKLGEWEGEGEGVEEGVFVKRKIQGFMRVPIAGYIERKKQSDKVRQTFPVDVIAGLMRNSQYGFLDTIAIYWKAITYDWREVEEDELVRAGAIINENSKLNVNQEMLQKFLASRVFDWKVGELSATVVVINESGSNGLASDVAEYLTNMGFDVVSVRSGEGDRDLTELVVQDEVGKNMEETLQLMENLFGWSRVSIEPRGESRSMLTVLLGRDAEKLF